MKRLLVLTTTTILLLGWMGCSGTPENETPPPETSSNPMEPEGSFSTYGDPSDRMGTQLANIAEAIENVEDEASARAAAQEIAKANIELGAVAKSLEDMSDAERAAAAQQYSAKYSEQQVRIASAMQRLVQHPEWLRIISDEMKKMPAMRGNR